MVSCTSAHFGVLSHWFSAMEVRSVLALTCNRFRTGILLDQTGSRMLASHTCSSARMNWKDRRR